MRLPSSLARCVRRISSWICACMAHLQTLLSGTSISSLWKTICAFSKNAPKIRRYQSPSSIYNALTFLRVYFTMDCSFYHLFYTDFYQRSRPIGVGGRKYSIYHKVWPLMSSCQAFPFPVPEVELPASWISFTLFEAAAVAVAAGGGIMVVACGTEAAAFSLRASISWNYYRWISGFMSRVQDEVPLAPRRPRQSCIGRRRNCNFSWHPDNATIVDCCKNKEKGLSKKVLQKIFFALRWQCQKVNSGAMMKHPANP